MKWTVPQLRKLSKPFNFEFEMDLNNLLDVSDILRTSNTLISGVCKEISNDTYEFKIDINTMLYLECSVSLEEVEYKFESSISEIFGYDEEYYDDINIITKDTIDLTDVILSEIVISKPMKIVKKGYEEVFSDEPERTENVFASLKNTLGGEDQ